MAEKNKSGFHTVGDTDMEEYNRKIKEHRRKILRRTVIVTAVFLLVLTGLGLYMALRHYGCDTFYGISGKYFKIQQ